MAVSTMDNASAQLAIALQLRDLDELEASGTVDKLVIHLQRQQLEIGSGFDAITFEASRRLAVSMAKAVEDDSALLTRSTLLPQIDDTTFERLASLNHLPTTESKGIEQVQQLGSAGPTLSSTAESQKPGTSSTAKDEFSVNPKDTELRSCSHAAFDHAGQCPQKKPKVRGEQISSSQKLRILVEKSEISLVQDAPASTAAVSGAQVMTETPTSANIVETSPAIADCASCSEPSGIDELVKASCEHYYCRDCFGHFIEASLQTHDGFPPKCCKIPIAFVTVANNVSTAVFSRYSVRQAEIKNATALY